MMSMMILLYTFIKIFEGDIKHLDTSFLINRPPFCILAASAHNVTL